MISCPNCKWQSNVEDQSQESLTGFLFECEKCLAMYETRYIVNEQVFRKVRPVRDHNGYIIHYEYEKDDDE